MPGISRKRGSFQTSTARYQKPRKSAKPISIRYGRGLFSHSESRYIVSPRVVISSGCGRPARRRTCASSSGTVNSRVIIVANRSITASPAIASASSIWTSASVSMRSTSVGSVAVTVARRFVWPSSRPAQPNTPPRVMRFSGSRAPTSGAKTCSTRPETTTKMSSASPLAV